MFYFYVIQCYMSFKKKDPNWNKPKSFFFVVFILLVDLVPVNCTVMKLYPFLCKLLIKKNINQLPELKHCLQLNLASKSECFHLPLKNHRISCVTMINHASHVFTEPKFWKFFQKFLQFWNSRHVKADTLVCMCMCILY